MSTPQARFEITADDKTQAAFRSALSEGQKFSKQMSTILKAGVVGVAAAEISAQLKKAFSLGDSIGNLAAATGLTASSASELSRVFQQLGLDESLLTASLRKMQVELSKGNSEFAKLGLSAQSLKSKGADRALEDIAQAISEIPNPADRAAAAARIFGEDAGPRLLKLLNHGKEGIQEIRKELGGFSDDDIEKMQRANEAFRKLDLFNDKVWGSLAVQVTRAMTALGAIDRDAAGELGDDLREAEAALADLMEGPGRFDKSAIADARSEIALLKAEIERARIGAGSGTRGGGAFRPTGTGITIDHTAEAAAASKAYAAAMADEARAAEKLSAALSGVSQEMIEFGNQTSLPAFTHTAAEEMRQEFDALVKYADDSMAQFNRTLKDAATEAEPYFEEIHRSMFSAFSDAFYNLGTGANNFADDMIDAFKRVLANHATLQLFDMLAQLGSDMEIKGKSNSANGGGNAALAIVGGWIGSLFGFADGGRPPLDRPSIVGERGPELFWPDAAGTIVPNHALATAGGITYSPTIHIDARGATQEAIKLLPGAMKQASNDAVARILQLRNEGRF